MKKLFELKRTSLYVLRTYVYVSLSMNVRVLQNTYIHVLRNNRKHLVNVIAIIFTLPRFLILHIFRLNHFNTKRNGLVEKFFSIRQVYSMDKEK